jgi:hypothetical protein
MENSDSEGFEKVDHEEWARFQGKGEQALEKLLDRTLLIKVKRYLS